MLCFSKTASMQYEMCAEILTARPISRRQRGLSDAAALGYAAYAAISAALDTRVCRKKRNSWVERQVRDRTGIILGIYTAAVPPGGTYNRVDRRKWS